MSKINHAKTWKRCAKKWKFEAHWAGEERDREGQYGARCFRRWQACRRALKMITNMVKTEDDIFNEQLIKDIMSIAKKALEEKVS
jgi:hypothetical protein